MTVRRLVLTAVAMTAVAAALRVLTGPWQSALATLANATTVSVASRPEDVVLAAAGLLGWVVWAWGALGLLLTAASPAPGVYGTLARGLSRVVLPASLRTAAGLALGAGLVVAAPGAAAAPAADPVGVAVPDWPTGGPAATTPAPPDWPVAAANPDGHLVVPGDCLWRIAEDRLRQTGADPTDADVAIAVGRWWTANAAVIGPDPDLLQPGQVLLPPTDTAPPSTTHPLRSTR